MRSLYTAAKARGFVVVGYYDTRAATLAQHTLTGQALGTQRLDVHFSLPKDDREASQVSSRVALCGWQLQQLAVTWCTVVLVVPVHLLGPTVSAILSSGPVAGPNPGMLGASCNAAGHAAGGLAQRHHLPAGAPLPVQPVRRAA